MRVLVTGGAGFLGSHIVELLLCLREGRSFASVKAPTPYDEVDEAVGSSQHSMLSNCFQKCEVRVFDLHPKVLNKDSYNENLWEMAEWIQGDITDYEQVLEAVRGCEAVIHSASMIDFGNTKEEVIRKVNVEGTLNIIRACKECNVKALVYSSSIEVLQAKEGVRGGNEELPYVMDTGQAYLESVYLMTKTEAEKLVLKENASTTSNGDPMMTAAVRPSGMYGERDRIHLAHVLHAAKNAGAFNFVRIGDGSKMFQHVYAGNVAHMHLCVLKRLMDQDDRVGGEAFMGIDATKVNNFFDFFEPYLAAKGYRVPTIHAPAQLMYVVARIAEIIKYVLDLIFPSMRKLNNVLTQESVLSLNTDVWFKTDKAERLAGFKPIVSPMRARALGIAHFLNRPDYPQGNFTYKTGQFDYMDDGTSYLPDMLLIEKRRRAMVRKVRYFFALTTLLLSFLVIRRSV